MSNTLRDGYIYFPPFVVGGPTGDYETKCPLDSAGEAELQIITIATQDTGQPRVLISSRLTPGVDPLPLDGSVALGQRNGSDQGTNAFPGILMTGSGAGALKIGNNVFFPIVDDQKHVYIRIDCASSNSVFLTCQYRVRPIRKVVGDVVTVHEDHEQQHNIAREQQAIRQLNAKTIQGRGEAINI